MDRGRSAVGLCRRCRRSDRRSSPSLLASITWTDSRHCRQHAVVDPDQQQRRQPRRQMLYSFFSRSSLRRDSTLLIEARKSFFPLNITSNSRAGRFLFTTKTQSSEVQQNWVGPME
ncbi:hypothetical protein Y032_0665g1323 [Ancylostoma ceylanicum]|uniref:Uncharacterized protein n=1 Tax=Ancylostoma ceylanicum TaxID=53326 RepID=A0A016WI22_9BILA|nr:hypothetical protein Y032_0665g1323 [Ancylostoma ceylanicum]